MKTFTRTLKTAGIDGQKDLGFFGGYEYGLLKDTAKEQIDGIIGNGQQVQNLVKTTITGAPDTTGAKVNPSAPVQAQPQPAAAPNPKQMLMQDLKNTVMGNLPKGMAQLAQGQYGQYAQTLGRGFMDLFRGSKSAGLWDTYKNTVTWTAGTAAKYLPGVSTVNDAMKTVEYGVDTVAPMVQGKVNDLKAGVAKGLVGSPLIQTAGKQIATGITDSVLGQNGLANEYGGTFGRAMAHGAFGDFKGMFDVITGPKPAQPPAPTQPQ